MFKKGTNHMKHIYPQKLNLILALGIVAFMAIWPGYVLAQEGTIKVTDQSTEAEFRDHLTFYLSAESKTEIVEADLLYKIKGQIATSRNQADFTPGTSIDAEFVINQTEPGNYFPPGTELQYWWKLVDAEGNELTTDRETLLYLDDRYDWQTLENDRLALYWYEGSDNFGQKLFDRANEALDTLENDLGVNLEEPIKIFIYANQNDFLNAYFYGSQEWAGGAAFDEYGVVMMAVDPRQPDWGTIVTTHEMTHLVIHRATDNYLTGDLTLPRWLDEGIAVYTSGEIYTRSDFDQALGKAIENDQLLTLRTLSSPFSSDTDEAILSYAQSGAVVKFIIDTHGPEAMSKLLNALSEGSLYDEALQQALGLDTDGLDNAFRENLELPPLPQTQNNAVGEEEVKPAQEPGVAENEETATEEPAPTTENIAEETSEGPTSIPGQPAVETTTEKENSLLGLQCCLAGIVPLLLLAGWYVLKR